MSELHERPDASLPDAQQERQKSPDTEYVRLNRRIRSREECEAFLAEARRILDQLEQTEPGSS